MIIYYNYKNKVNKYDNIKIFSYKIITDKIILLIIINYIKIKDLIIEHRSIILLILIL